MEKSHLMFELHHKTAYRKSGTRDPGLVTWNPYMGPRVRDPPPGTLHLGSGTRDPRQDQGSETFTGDPGPRTLNLGLFTWEPGPYLCEPGPNTFTWNAGPILRNPYINTTFP